ncbi:hypothetical protein LCGC14_2315360, partial [marine sediment metagenome]
VSLMNMKKVCGSRDTDVLNAKLCILFVLRAIIEGSGLVGE